MHTLLYRGGGEISPHLPLTPYSNFDASASNLEVLLLRLTGTQCEPVYYKRVSACVFATSCAWRQMSAPRPLIGQQTMRAEWHMFLPLMTRLSRPGDRARRRRGGHHLTCKCARIPPLCISLILHFVLQILWHHGCMPKTTLGVHVWTPAQF